MSNKNLKDYLMGEIEKSGFPLEIEVSTILEKEKWRVINNKPYIDEEKGELRSIDISSFHGPTAFDFDKYEPLAFSPNLVIECKKSTNCAWVFFSRPTETKVLPMSGHVYDFPKLFSTNAYKEKDKFAGFPFSYEYFFNYYVEKSRGLCHLHYSDLDRTAITYHEYKIKKEKSTQRGREEIFEAINQIIKFQSFDVKENISHIKTAISPYFPMFFTFLAIIFEGELIEVVFKDGESQLKEVKHLVLEVRYRPNYSSIDLEYWIDIVKKSELSIYLTKINNDISLISDKILANSELLKSYLKKD